MTAAVAWRAPCPRCGLTADWQQQFTDRKTVTPADFAINCRAHCDRPTTPTPCLPAQRPLLARITERLSK